MEMRNDYTFSEITALENRIRSLYDEELVNMMQHPEAYVPEALAIARDEINKRGGIKTLKQSAEQRVQIEKEEETKGDRARDLHILLVKVLSTVPSLFIMMFIMAAVLATFEEGINQNHIKLDDIPDWARNCAKMFFPILLLPVLWIIWRLVSNHFLKMFPPKS